MVCAALAEGGVVCFGYDDTVRDEHAGGVYSYLAKPSFVECGIMGGAIECWEMPGDWGSHADNNAAKVAGVPLGEDWRAVEQSSSSACALDAGGRISCWGKVSDPAWSGETLFVPTGAGWLDVTMAPDCELCALDSEGHVQCFPTPDQLENGTCRERPFGDEVYVDVESNYGQLAAIRLDGRVDLFYNAANSTIGTTETDGYLVVSPWRGDTCALTAGGTIDCWGGGAAPNPYPMNDTYTDLLLVDDLYGIDSQGQLHWNGDDSPNANGGKVSFWDAVGVPNPDDP